MKRPQNRWRWVAIVIPILIFVGGTVIFALNGWDYAKQTFLRSDRHLSAYQPNSVAQATQTGQDGQANTPAAPQAKEANPLTTKAPIKQARTLGTSLRDTSHTAHVVIWPTLPTPGTEIGVLSFPTIGLHVPVVQGTYDGDLKLGAGHYIASPLPGQGGNVLLSGHRDTVFTKLKYLKVGDKVIFTTPYGNFVYRMTSTKIVPKDDTSAVRPTNYETLTLTTCYPFYYIGSAPNRYIVYTKLVSQPNVGK